MNKSNQEKVIWVDLLCLDSLWGAVNLARRHGVSKVFYFNASKGFEKIIPFLEKRLKISFIQVTDFVESEEKIDGVNAHEYTQIHMGCLMDQWMSEPASQEECRRFCQAHRFSPEKFTAHLKEAAFFYVLRPVQIFVCAEKRAGLDRSIFLLRKSPFSRLLKNYLGTERTFFYRVFTATLWPMQKRPFYVYDEIFEKTYYASRLVPILKAVYAWTCDLVNYGLNRKEIKTAADQKSCKIGLEITQHRIRREEINDVFWLQESGIDPETVCGLGYGDCDEGSARLIQEIGIPYYKYLKRIGKPKSASVNVLLPQPQYFAEVFPYLFKLLYPLFLWNEQGWRVREEVYYFSRTMFWMSVYRQLGIRLVWTMYDMDPDKLPKGEAVKQLGGLYLGGHWSNNPLYRIDNQKCFDVVLSWGPHFLKSNFSYYPYLDVIPVGYPSDHYFEKHRDWAQHFKAQYPGKFILSYHDNSGAHDIPASYKMNIQMHQLLIGLLKKYDHLIVLLKPKRKHEFEQVLSDLPELRSFIKEGRICTFIGDTPRTKAVPAAIGLASDLAVGLSISTAVAECFFAGIVAFHADLTGFTHNDFANEGEGAIVFRNLESLQKAIEDRITGRNALSHADYRKYYERLDPFQDGQSYKRTGFLIKKMQEGLQRGLSREAAVAYARKEYENSDWFQAAVALGKQV